LQNSVDKSIVGVVFTADVYNKRWCKCKFWRKYYQRRL